MTISVIGRSFETVTVSLTPQLEKLVQRKVKSGRYGSASEVVREALRLLEKRDRLAELRHEELRREIQKGIDSGPSEPFDAEEIKRESRALLRARPRGG